MKVIIAGSRHMPKSDYPLVDKAVKDSGFDVTEVVCGLARGGDLLGERWGNEHGVSVTYFPAEWKRYGRAAGPIRNEQMALYGDALIVFLYPNSRGSLNMLQQMTKLGKSCFAVHPETRQLLPEFTTGEKE